MWWYELRSFGWVQRLVEGSSESAGSIRQWGISEYLTVRIVSIGISFFCVVSSILKYQNLRHCNTTTSRATSHDSWLKFSTFQWSAREDITRLIAHANTPHIKKQRIMKFEVTSGSLEMREILHFLDLSTSWMRVSSFTFWPLYLRGNTWPDRRARLDIMARGKRKRLFMN
jgi:hypothetical protein